MKKCYFHPETPFALLKVTGEDAFPFLQGQFTADLKPLENESEAETVHGLFLDNRGKMQADAFIQRFSEGFLVYAPTIAPEVLWQRLDDYLIADEVELEDLSPDRFVFTVGIDGSDLPHHGAYFFPSRRWPSPCYDVILPADSVVAFRLALEEADLAKAGAEEVVLARAMYNLPRVPQDTGSRLLPQEAGFEPLVSYTKGCFLGQEVMARFKNFGAKRRGLFPVKAKNSPFPSTLPLPLLCGGKKGGELISWDRIADDEGVGFAMLPLEWQNSTEPLKSENSGDCAYEILKPSRKT